MNFFKFQHLIFQLSHRILYLAFVAKHMTSNWNDIFHRTTCLVLPIMNIKIRLNPKSYLKKSNLLTHSVNLGHTQSK